MYVRVCVYVPIVNIKVGERVGVVGADEPPASFAQYINIYIHL